MDYNSLQCKKEFYQRYKNILSDFALQNYEQAFEIEYTHNSTAIEGNTLSLIETKEISIAKESRLEYFDALESYAVNADLKPFANFIAALEEQKLDLYIRAIEQHRAIIN